MVLRAYNHNDSGMVEHNQELCRNSNETNLATEGMD